MVTATDVVLDLQRWLRGYRAEWQAVAEAPAPLGSIEQIAAIQVVVALDRVRAELDARHVAYMEAAWQKLQG